MHINRKRQSDSQTALDAQSSAQEARPTPRTFGAFSLQRVALACFGVLGTGGLLVLAGCPANLENPERFDVAGAGAPATGGAAPTGGGGGSAGGGITLPTGVDLTTCITPLFVKSCATSSICHAANSATGLDLVTPGFELRLVNVPAKHMLAGVTDCPMVNLVDTTTPSKSWLVSKVNPTGFGDCGSLMPLGATAAAPVITPADIACITKFANDEAAAANKGAAPAGAAGAAATGTGGSGGM